MGFSWDVLVLPDVEHPLSLEFEFVIDVESFFGSDDGEDGCVRWFEPILDSDDSASNKAI